jgi:hypothetical protein
MPKLPAGLVRPLSWIGTVNVARDQGLFHLVKEVPLHGLTFAFPACGSRPFSTTGSYPDGHPVVGNQRCARCEAIAVRARAEVVK